MDSQDISGKNIKNIFGLGWVNPIPQPELSTSQVRVDFQVQPDHVQSVTSKWLIDNNSSRNRNQTHTNPRCSPRQPSDSPPASGSGRRQLPARLLATSPPLPLLLSRLPTSPASPPPPASLSPPPRWRSSSRKSNKLSTGLDSSKRLTWKALNLQCEQTLTLICGKIFHKHLRTGRR